MNVSLATQIVSATTANTQNSLALTMLKQQHNAEMSVVNMLAQAVQAPAPQGQGLVVDKVA